MKSGSKRVIVKEVKEESSGSGLYLGTNKVEGIIRGQVVDRDYDNDLDFELEENDIVQFQQAYSQKVKVEGEEYYVVRIGDILLVE